MAEEEYRNFSSRLMPTVEKEKVIGIRIPRLRAYAKTLEDYDWFLRELPHEYFEEDNLHAFLIEREKNFDRCIERLEAFLPYVDNWATCDSMRPKILRKEPEKLICHVKRWLASGKTYTVRYAIGLLMSFYLDESFDKAYLSLVAEVKSGEYYVNMMRAWYFATALAKRYDEALPYIEKGLLDVWTHNKTIQKACESLRISREQKVYLKGFLRGGKL